MIIEKEAAQSWHDMQRAIDELNSNGNEIPVYRAALTLPLMQAGITAVVGAIAEFPSGFTLFLLNTGGAGEVFLICAIDGVWRVWTVTPSSGGMPLIDPATLNNFALQNADGSLYDAGFGDAVYARLLGRAGGQTLIGGTAVDNRITLQGTSSAGNTATAIAFRLRVGDAGGTNAIDVLNNGNVGIGSTGGDERLTVRGNTRVDYFGQGILFGDGNSGNVERRQWFVQNRSPFTSQTGLFFTVSSTAGGTPDTDVFFLRQDGFVGVNTTTPAAQHHIVSGAAATIAQIIQLAATPTANAQEVRDSAGTVLSATRPDGSWQPPQIADAAAVNNSLYYSTTLSKLVFKDPAGTVNPLY